MRSASRTHGRRRRFHGGEPPRNVAPHRTAEERAVASTAGREDDAEASLCRLVEGEPDPASRREHLGEPPRPDDGLPDRAPRERPVAVAEAARELCPAGGGIVRVAVSPVVELSTRSEARELIRKSCIRIGVRVSVGLLSAGRVIGIESGTRTWIGQLPVRTSVPSARYWWRWPSWPAWMISRRPSPSQSARMIPLRISRLPAAPRRRSVSRRRRPCAK